MPPAAYVQNELGFTLFKGAYRVLDASALTPGLRPNAELGFTSYKVLYYIFHVTAIFHIFIWLFGLEVPSQALFTMACIARIINNDCACNQAREI